MNDQLHQTTRDAVDMGQLCAAVLVDQQTDANGLKTIAWPAMRLKPALAFTCDEAGDTMPVTFKVQSWATDANGWFTGAVVAGKRTRTLPGVLVLLSALISYDTTTPAVNTMFSALVISPSC